MDKRSFIKSVFLGSSFLFISSRTFNLKAAAGKKKWDGKFVVHPLAFAYSALEPHIDAHSLHLHHSVHYGAYAEQFNRVVKEAGLTGKTAYEILTNASKYSETIRNTGGGYLNHKLFWKMLAPAKGQQPSKELMNAITRDFGSFNAFMVNFSQAAESFPSDGWTWLIISNNRLKITSTTGNISPVMDTASEKGIPLLCLDHWKHAYAETYHEDKSAYIRSFWNVVNWDFVSLRFKRNHPVGV